MSEPNFSDLLSSVREDEASKRRYAQNSLIVDVALALNKGLSAAGLSQRTLAERLGKTEGFVSQVLSGGSNITLRTLGDFAYGMNCDVDVALRPQSLAISEWTYNTEAAVITPTGVVIKDCLNGGRDQAPAANADYALAA
jgi:transcriptional regulator with XRE-family HTH domain